MSKEDNKRCQVSGVSPAAGQKKTAGLIGEETLKNQISNDD
jgi:hypothetical protein